MATFLGPVNVGKLAVWALIIVTTWRLMPEARADAAAVAAAPKPPAAVCPPQVNSPAAVNGAAPNNSCPPPSASGGPLVWGAIGLQGYAAGTRVAPAGPAYDPLLSVTSDLNLGVLPNKQLYLFLQNDFWVQRTAASAPATNQREFDLDLGLAWNYFSSLELRGFAYSLNNLNRGTSLASPDGYKDGIGIENRYYFGGANIYDVGRLSFIGLGYYPTKDLVSTNGESFRPGLFAEAYLTHGLPTPFQSYLFAGGRVTAESAVSPHLLETDAGLAVRPVVDWPNFEFRLGDRLAYGLQQSGGARNLVYGAVRLGFGPDQAGTRPDDPSSFALPGSLLAGRPLVWGVVGLPVYVASNRMAPNGVPFSPIFDITSQLNFGILPDRKLYLFLDGTFWAQHSGAQITNASQGSFDFSKREMDSELGLAWNYFDALELRGSAYALNNLNRGISLTEASGGKQGITLENRYYLPGANPYDVGRSSFVGFGYTPTENLVGGNGASFRPGPFAHAYLARDVPLPWFESYLYAGVQATAQQFDQVRLFETDVGWAVRPFVRLQNLEFRIGDDLTQDISADTTRNRIYGAVRFEFGPRGFTTVPH